MGRDLQLSGLQSCVLRHLASSSDCALDCALRGRCCWKHAESGKDAVQSLGSCYLLTLQGSHSVPEHLKSPTVDLRLASKGVSQAQ